jgi:hypothetical protein
MDDKSTPTFSLTVSDSGCNCFSSFNELLRHVLVFLKFVALKRN